MKLRSIVSLAALPLMTAGALLSANSVKAADIGPGTSGTYVISTLASGGLNIVIAGGTASFDFFPPLAGGFGGYNVGASSGVFAGFTGLTGSILDTAIPFPLAPDTLIPFVRANFLTLDGPAGGPAPLPGTGNDFFDSVTLAAPTFTEIATGTTVEFGVFGNFRAADGRVLPGLGTLSATFAGQTQAQVIAAAQAPGGLITSNSGTFVLTIPDPVGTPEPSTMAGLAIVGASALFLRKRKG